MSNDSLSKTMTVWCVLYEHKHGTDLAVYAAEDQARAAAADLHAERDESIQVLAREVIS